MSYHHTNINNVSTAKQFGQFCQTIAAVVKSCKSHNASVRHPPMHRSEQKCVHFRSERCTAGRCPAITGGTTGCQYKSPSPRGGVWRIGWRRHFPEENEHRWQDTVSHLKAGRGARMASRLRCKHRFELLAMTSRYHQWVTLWCYW